MNESSDLEKKPFNWELVKRRLTDTVDDMRIPDDVQAILQRHARAIALDQPSLHEPSNHTHLCFVASNLRIAVALDDVRAVFVPWKVTAISGAPAHLSEAVHFEGRAVPLLHLAATLGLEGRPAEAARSQVVLLESEGRLLGVRSEEVVGPQFVDEKCLSREALAQDGAFVRGLTQDHVLVLDVHALIGAVTPVKR